MSEHHDSNDNPGNEDSAEFEEHNSQKHDFLIAQYQGLLPHIEFTFQAILNDGRLALLASGGIWAWIFGSDQPNATFRVAAALIPLGVTLLFLLRALFMWKAVVRYSGFITLVEKSYKLGPLSFSDYRTSNEIKIWPAFLYYGVMITANTIGAAFVILQAQ